MSHAGARLAVHTFVAVITVAAATVAATAPAAASSGPRAIGVGLTSWDHGGHAALGDGVALVMGATGFPTPADRYGDAVKELFLAPHGFTGTPQILTTPQLPDNYIESEAEGARILVEAIHRQIDGGGVDAENPVVVFGYSQSAAMSTFAMQQLHADGVPKDLVHFVFIGNTANPNGGLLSMFDIPPGTNASIHIPNTLDVTLGNPTPDDLYPTDVYTLEYDGFADFPRYPLNLLGLFDGSFGQNPINWFTVLNALMGLFLQHNAYLGLDHEQIANAIPLETAGHGLVNYFMIPSETLPLLEPLRLIPVLGQPLYDLLEPSTRILVNLGYGSIADGWNDGPANVEAPLGLFPFNLNLFEVYSALAEGWQQGVHAAVADLFDPKTYEITPLVDSPVFSALITSAYQMGVIDTLHPSSLEDVLNAFLGAFGLSPDADAAAGVGDLVAPALGFDF